MRETKRNEQGEEVKTTLLPFMADSCMACWNMPLTADQGPTAPRAHGKVVSVPVHLVEHSGKTTIVCYAARCMNCGHVRSYGAQNGIYKLNNGKADFNIEKWPEILRNNIDQFDFEEAVLNSKPGAIYLDARNGLKEPPIPPEWHDRFVKFATKMGWKLC